MCVVRCYNHHRESLDRIFKASPSARLMEPRTAPPHAGSGEETCDIANPFPPVAMRHHCAHPCSPVLACDHTATELVVNCAIPERNLARVAAAAPFNSTGFFEKERGLELGFLGVSCFVQLLYNANRRIGTCGGDLSGRWRSNGPHAGLRWVKTDSACSS
jgi:hypothetical protein